MIPMQIMIGQLTGQPLPVHQIEPTRIHTFNEHGNSISFGRSATRIEADRIKSIQSLERMRENLRKHYGNRMFTRNAIKRERLFPHNKTTLPSLLNDMLESGELLLYASDNRGMSTYSLTLKILILTLSQIRALLRWKKRSRQHANLC